MKNQQRPVLLTWPHSGGWEKIKRYELTLRRSNTADRTLQNRTVGETISKKSFRLSGVWSKVEEVHSSWQICKAVSKMDGH